MRRTVTLLALAACERPTTRAAHHDAAVAPDARGATRAVRDAAPAPLDAAPRIDLTRQTFDGRPGWLILGEHSHRYAETDLAAQMSSLDSLIDAHVIDTGVFTNLRPGYFAVVYGRFDSRAEAQAVADLLPGEVYVKLSGPVRAAGDAPAPPRLVRLVGRFDSSCDTGIVVMKRAGGDAGVVTLATYELATFAVDVTEVNDGIGNEIWTNLTGPVELDLSSPCDGHDQDIICIDETVALPAAGGDVEARFECHTYRGE